MLTGKQTPARKTGRGSAAVLGMLLSASAHPTPAVGADSALTLAAGTSLYGYFGEIRGVAVPAQRTANLHEILRHTVDPAHGSIGGEAVDGSLSDLLAKLHYAFSRNLGLSSDRARQSEREVLVRNSDAFVRTNLRLGLAKEWRGFVYADLGAADSALRWQGLAGVRGGRGVALLGGWRHVTYHFSPGKGFDSLDFDGPYLGATLAW
jgi:hypothetical protein